MVALLGLGACFSETKPNAETGDDATSTATTASGPTDTGEPGTSTTIGTDTDPDGTTGPDTSLCGNGEPDEGEDCDDGNDVDADGCTRDCRISGSVIWIEVLDNGTAGASDAFLAVAVDAEGEIYAGGTVTGMADDANLVRYDADYGLVYDEPVVATTGLDNLRAILVAASGTVYVAGDRDIVPGVSGVAWIASVDDAGGLMNPHSLPSAGRNAFYALAEEAGGIVAAGHRGEGAGTAAHVEHYTPILTAKGGKTPAVSDGPDQIAITTAVTSDAFGVYTGGHIAQTGLNRGFATPLPEGGLVHVDADANANTFIVDAVLRSPGDMSAGFVTAGWSNPVAGPPAIARLNFVDRSGMLSDLQTWSGPDDMGAFYDGLGVDGAGNLVVAGGLSQDPTGNTAFVRKLDPTGAQLWLQTLEPDGFAFGAVNALAIAPDDRIAAAGSASDVGGVARRLIAVLAP